MNEKTLKGQVIEPLSGSLFGDVILDRGDQEIKHNILITVSNAEGAKTVLITPDSVMETSPKHPSFPSKSRNILYPARTNGEALLVG